MSQEKKKRTRRSAEKMAELVLEAERVGASLVCRREGIAPAQLSRWKQKFLQGGFAPNAVHHSGRKKMMERRLNARQQAQELRRKHWEQETSPSTDLLT